MPWMMSFATCLARFDRMENPTPMLPSAPPFVAIAVLMPTTSPFVLTRAPPELPGLIDASVWIAPAISGPWVVDCCWDGSWPNGSSGFCGVESSEDSSIVRFRALTMPAVTVPSSPNGAPIARTVSPTCSALLSPKVAARSC